MQNNTNAWKDKEIQGNTSEVPSFRAQISGKKRADLFQRAAAYQQQELLLQKSERLPRVEDKLGEQDIDKQVRLVQLLKKAKEASDYPVYVSDDSSDSDSNSSSSSSGSDTSLYHSASSDSDSSSSFWDSDSDSD